MSWQAPYFLRTIMVCFVALPLQAALLKRAWPGANCARRPDRRFNWSVLAPRCKFISHSTAEVGLASWRSPIRVFKGFFPGPTVAKHLIYSPCDADADRIGHAPFRLVGPVLNDGLAPPPMTRLFKCLFVSHDAL